VDLASKLNSLTLNAIINETYRVGLKNRPLYYSVKNATAFVYMDRMTHHINC